MSAPSFVPRPPNQRVRRYTSPPRRDEGWSANRAGELTSGQPTGPKLGTQGPDQGFAYKLVDHVGDLHLGGVSRADAVAGCVAIAMKRSAVFGRGPVIDDVRAGFTVWGFLDPSPADDLVQTREQMFSEIHHHHHYSERREVVDAVSTETLSQPFGAIADAYRSGWRNNLSI